MEPYLDYLVQSAYEVRCSPKHQHVLLLRKTDRFHLQIPYHRSVDRTLEYDLHILYEDENILLVDKRQGMIVHSDDKESFNTLINHILSYLYQKGEYNPQAEHAFRPSLCNRIDRNTGGIVIAAKNAETLKIINEKIKNNEIDSRLPSIQREMEETGE